MVFHQGIHRSLYDAAEVHALLIERIDQRLFVEFSDAAVEADGQGLPPVVLHDIAAEEGAETLLDQTVYLGLFEVLLQERYKRGKEGVGLGLTIDTVDNLSWRKLKLLEETITDGLWKLILQHVAYKDLTKHGTTTFVAENETER